METTSEPEREPLLQGEAGEASEAATSAPQIPGVLPVAFAAAFAIAATSATTIFAYAIIICEDPAHCKDGEQSHYSGASAFAASMANVLGIVTITVLGRWVQSQPRLGLGVWLASRGIGIIIVAIGGKVRTKIMVGSRLNCSLIQYSCAIFTSQSLAKFLRDSQRTTSSTSPLRVTISARISQDSSHD